MHPLHPTLAILTLLVAPLTACDPPEADEPFMGSVPTPSGVIHGTVFYAGPRPSCTRDADGAPIEVRGNVILLLFFADNPPPPAGSATSAENLLVIPARDIFDRGDCLPQRPTAEDLAQTVTRSSGFDWSDIALLDEETIPASTESCSATAPHGSCEPGRMCESARERPTFGTCVEPRVDYQVRGFFDRDADFNPFFSVRRLATRGDVAGGAFVNLAASPPQFERITFGSHQAVPNGQELDGVTVAIAAVVNTELPAFELSGNTRAASSESVVPATSNAIVRERMIWEQTEMEISLIAPYSAPWTATLEAAGMSIDPQPSGFGFFIQPVDANRDGVQDAHPLLGAAGVLWEHPIVILRRARNPYELAVGIPDALLIATVRPTQTIARDTFAPSIEIGVAPIAAVSLGACQIPYIAPGNIAETYERVPVDCQELPTGNFDINVLSGIAGGTPLNYRHQLQDDLPELPASVLETLVRSRTDNDWVIEGGSYSSQAWTIPNELGCPDPVYRPNALDQNGSPIAVSQLDEDPFASCGDPRRSECDATGTLMQCSQGPAGRFSVVDPDGANAPDHTNTTAGHGIATCQTTIRGATMMPDSVAYMPVPSECCDAVRHLCDLPLCPLRPRAIRPGAEGASSIREMSVLGEDFTQDEDGTITPRCVPFLPPASCCA